MMLLNKTAGRVALPIFWALIARWPTPESLAQGLLVCCSISVFAQGSRTVSLALIANHAELENFIRCLGLQSVRARRLIILSTAYLEHFHDKPEQPGSQDPSTPISHLPGSGPYALDSYRIYCGGPDAWRTVMPRDKELIRFIVRLFFSLWR